LHDKVQDKERNVDERVETINHSEIGKKNVWKITEVLEAIEDGDERPITDR